jgi:hypothetical protein
MDNLALAKAARFVPRRSARQVFFGKLNDQAPIREIFRSRSYKEGIRTVLSHCCDDAAKFLFPERMV